MVREGHPQGPESSSVSPQTTHPPHLWPRPADIQWAVLAAPSLSGPQSLQACPSSIVSMMSPPQPPYPRPRPPCLQSQPLSSSPTVPEEYFHTLPFPPHPIHSPPWLPSVPRSESQPLRPDFEALHGLCSPHSPRLTHFPLLPPQTGIYH